MIMDQPINPYAPPQILAPTQQPGEAPRLVVVRPYQSARGKAQVAMGAVTVSIVLQTIMAISFLMQLFMLYDAESGAGLDPAAANANDLRQQVIGGILVLSTLVSLITLLVWVYAVHVNLPALGATKLDFTPGWSVGWFFIPIMNLFKPYQAVSEIWYRSQAAPHDGRPALGAALVGWWWGLRIASAITERGFTAYSRQADTIDTLISVSWIAIILTFTLDAPMFVTQLLMIRRIQRFQEERYEQISRGPPASSATGANPFASFE
jgi:uncharacterized protein DUF4328